MQVPVLRRGDRVAVVAPCGPTEAGVFTRGMAWLRARYDTVVYGDPCARNGYLAGTDDDRSRALLQALRDRTVCAVMAARGGYGAMRVLEHSGEEILTALRERPRVLVGFSDVTALHALWFRAGVRAVHGPMQGALSREDCDSDRAALERVLAGSPAETLESLGVLSHGSARGRAVGSNLSLIAALQGTPWAVPLRGNVLFLEDIGEKPYRIDRMLTSLRLSGALQSVAAIVLGEFTDCGREEDPAPTCADVLRERLDSLGVPVVTGARFGHGTFPGVIAFGDHVDVSTHGSTGVVRTVDVAHGVFEQP